LLGVERIPPLFLMRQKEKYFIKEFVVRIDSLDTKSFDSFSYSNYTIDITYLKEYLWDNL
jgi:hypothetical protein